MSAATSRDRVLVKCGVCGLKFDASPRSARDYRAGRREPRCVLHRTSGPGVTADVLATRKEATERAALRRFWLERFSRREIIQMANALFPRGTDRGLPSALTASAREQTRGRSR